MDERYRVLKNSQEVSELNGLAFEEYLAQIFRELGYAAKKTVASGDFGADVILEDGNKVIVVQAKQYASSVGVDAIKESYFALGFYDADEAWVVTTSTFTPQAITAARKTGVKLISGRDLDVLIERAHSADSGDTCIAESKQIAKGQEDFELIAVQEAGPEEQRFEVNNEGAFHLGEDFVVADYVISSNGSSMGSTYEYCICDDSEFDDVCSLNIVDCYECESAEFDCASDPSTITLRKGTYLLLFDAIAVRISSPPVYLRKCNEALEAYDSQEWERCWSSVYDFYQILEKEVYPYGSIFEFDLERDLSLEFRDKYGLDSLLVSKMELLHDCAEVRNWPSLDKLNTGLLETASRVIQFRIDELSIKDQVEFYEFISRLVAETSTYALQAEEKKIARMRDTHGLSESYGQRELNESKEKFGFLYTQLMERIIGFCRQPDNDIRHLLFVKSRLNSEEKEYLGKERARFLDEQTAEVLLEKYGDDYQNRLRQFQAERVIQLEKLDDQLCQAQIRPKGLASLSSSKRKQRNMLLQEIAAKKKIVQDELDRSNQIVIEELWEAVFRQFPSEG